MKHILAILIIIASNLPLFAQHVPEAHWENIHPLPQVNTLKAVKMIDSNFYIAVGEGGTVIRTTDDGKTWDIRSQLNYSPRAITSVDFCTPSTGIVVATNVISFTNDSGKTWKPFVTEGSFALNTVYYHSPSLAFCIGKRGGIYTSLDSGKNWHGTPINTSYNLHDMRFISPSHGYIGTLEGAFFETFDTGRTWIERTVELGGGAKAMDFYDSMNGAICGDISLSVTTDGGMTWQAKPIPINLYAQLNDVVMLSPERIIVASNRRQIFVSTNGGASWTNSEKFGTWKYHGVSFAPDASNGIVVGDNGVMVRTYDGGKTWKHLYERIIDDPIMLTSIWAFDSLNAIACGSSGLIVRTSDAGNTWEHSYLHGLIPLTDIHFQTRQSGTIVGYYGFIYRTEDGGETWYEQDSRLINNHFNKVFFCDTNNGIAASNHGILRHTSDGGRSWIPTTSLSDSMDIKDVEYLEPWVVVLTANHAYLDYKGDPFLARFIFRSTNKGVTWQTSYTDTLARNFVGLGNISFVSKKIGYCLEDGLSNTPGGTPGTTLYKTTDGGITWDTTASTLQIAARDMKFVNEHSGTVVGEYGLCAHTYDGGLNWVYPLPVTSLTLTSVSHGSLNSAFSVGTRTAILRLHTNDTLVTLHTPTAATGPDELVCTIYPNPTTTMINVEFSLREATVASIAIYDIKGRRMGVIGSRMYSIGINFVEFDVSQFASGLYFLELTSESGSALMKFVVKK